MQKNQLDQETNISTATKQAVNGRDENGRFAIGNKPTVGFHTNPERRSDGRWRKEDSVTYQYRRMLAMTDDELEAFIPETQAQKIAKVRVMRAVRGGSCDSDEISSPVPLRFGWAPINTKQDIAEDQCTGIRLAQSL